MKSLFLWAVVTSSPSHYLELPLSSLSFIPSLDEWRQKPLRTDYRHFNHQKEEIRSRTIHTSQAERERRIWRKLASICRSLLLARPRREAQQEWSEDPDFRVWVRELEWVGTGKHGESFRITPLGPYENAPRVVLVLTGTDKISHFKSFSLFCYKYMVRGQKFTLGDQKKVKQRSHLLENHVM